MKNTPLQVSDGQQGATNGVITSYSVAALIAVTVQVVDPLVKKIVIYNETGTLYIALALAASDTNYTYRLTANTSQEIQHNGIITVIKASGTSVVRVTQCY